MKKKMGLALAEIEQCEQTVAEPVTRSHRAELARLMFAAYQGTVDDEGETLEDAVREIEKTFQGEYGPLLADCSFVIGGESSGQLASAILFTRYQDVPLLAFLMTHPDYKRQGYGRGLVREGLAALRRAGYSQVHLAVNPANEPALGLYHSLGFREVEE